MLGLIYSALPRSAQRKMLAWAAGGAGNNGDLTNMRNVEAVAGPFDYRGDEFLDRGGAYASFAVRNAWSEARWGVTFQALRDFDPDWSDVLSAMRKAKVAIMTNANEIYSTGSFEQDGSVLVRN